MIAMYRKQLFVFWVQTGSGILLQNVNTNNFIELDKIQERIWAYLDGTFSEDNILEVVSNENKDLSKDKLKETIQSTLAILLDYDLITNN